MINDSSDFRIDAMPGEHAAIGMLLSRRGGEPTPQRSSGLTHCYPARAASVSTSPDPGNHHPSIAPYGSFQCRGGTIVIACGNDDLRPDDSELATLVSGTDRFRPPSQQRGGP
jgi:crotonobetainyl-CoA:carnitine CoA-transferase CaiB-like acyl-CoA transferase